MSVRFPRKGEGTKSERRVIYIFTEGKRTEPDYFNSLRDELKIRGTNLDIRPIPIERQTTSLVQEVVARVESAGIRTDETDLTDDVWVVFDKDDESDFDNAITLAKSRGMKVAYSNEAFELWYYLHFNRLETTNTRKEYIEKLEREIQKIDTLKKFRYKKGVNIYDLIREGQDRAIKYAQDLEGMHSDQHNHNKKNPCTTVHHLVLALRSLKQS